MALSENLQQILNRIEKRQQTDEDITILCEQLQDGNRQLSLQLGKYNVNIGEGKDIHIGDRVYQGADLETIKNAFIEILKDIINHSIFSDSLLQNKSKNIVKTSSFPIQSPPPKIVNIELEVVTLDALEKEKYGYKRAKYFIETLSDCVILDIVSIPGGTFLMGSPREEETSQEDERPQHIVDIQSFFMGRYPITQEQWKVIANFPQVNRYLEPKPSFFKGNKLPVERVSWYHAREFCDRLSQKTGRKYRLPTEAEWEYACRARTSTPFHFGRRITANLANYASQDDRDRQQTKEIGCFPANDFGLCDMHGLVWEWCEDYENENYYDAPLDGSAWLNNGNDAYRIMRGGSWNSSAHLCRSASRFSGNPSVPKKEVGFRVVCSEI